MNVKSTMISLSAGVLYWILSAGVGSLFSPDHDFFDLLFSPVFHEALVRLFVTVLVIVLILVFEVVLFILEIILVFNVDSVKVRLVSGILGVPVTVDLV